MEAKKEKEGQELPSAGLSSKLASSSRDVPEAEQWFQSRCFYFYQPLLCHKSTKNKENTPGYVHAFYKCHLEFSSVQNQSAFLILNLIFVPDCRETQKYVYVEIWYSFGHRNDTFESLFRTNSIYGTGILSLLSRSSSKTVQCHSFFLARSSAVSEGWGYFFYCLSSSTVMLAVQRGSRQFLCLVKIYGNNAAAVQRLYVSVCVP